MIDKMILDRLPKTIKHAENFSKEHPELDLEELTQDLILFMVETMHGYKGQNHGNYNQHAWSAETGFMKSLLKAKEFHDSMFEEIKDLSGVPDESNKAKIKTLLDQDIAFMLDSLSGQKRFLIEHRYGLNGSETVPLEEIAKIFMLARSVGHKYIITHLEKCMIHVIIIPISALIFRL